MRTARHTRHICSTAWRPRTTLWRRPCMHAPTSYDYALIRLVPSVERGECLNIGVILFCRTLDFLGVRIYLNAARALALSPALDLTAIQRQLDSILLICEGGPEAGPLGKMSQSERFHWLV